MKPDQRRYLVPFALLATYLIWGSTYYGMSVVIKSLPPFLMGGIRYSIAGALLMLLLHLRGVPLPTRVQWRNAAIVGALLLSVGNGAVGFALQFINSSTTALLVATTPAWAAVIAAFFTRVIPRWIEWVGIALGIAGVALLVSKNSVPVHPLGVAALLAGTISWALGSIWSKGLEMPPGLMSSAAQMLLGGAMLLVLSAANGEHVRGALSPQSLIALAYLIAFGSMVAFSAYSYLLKTVTPALATSNTLVNPMVAVMIGVALGGEPFDVTIVAAMVVILLGVALLAIVKDPPQEPS